MAFLFLLVRGEGYAFLYSFITFVFFLVFSKITVRKGTRILGEGDAYALLPLLMWIPLASYPTFFILSTLLASPFAVYATIKKEGTIPFIPFLTASALLIQSNQASFYFLVALYAITLVSFLIYVVSKIKKRN